MNFALAYLSQWLMTPMFKLTLAVLCGLAVLALVTGNFLTLLLIVPHILSIGMILLCMKFIWSAPFKLLRKSLVHMGQDVLHDQETGRD